MVPLRALVACACGPVDGVGDKEDGNGVDACGPLLPCVLRVQHSQWRFFVARCTATG